MPNIFQVNVYEARDLPTTDAKVQIKWADLDTLQTEPAISHSGAPTWDHQEFRIELLEDRYVQDEPMRFEVLDNRLGAEDIIGRVSLHTADELCEDLQVYLDVTCLAQDKEDKDQLTWGPGSIKGWFPIYDTLRGCCGELYIKVIPVLLAVLRKEVWMSG